eukprot:gnl/TRDRNA2_/TRDRNA2_93700_c0_seq2.p1 gnl/TRDRNA2_/TRDRNA2_93700_c0~~gnl/TRDRNA2_/TRDRNA2_93700_c0_seq2.p1  ORF type:complete len:412 (+),score=28.92 gnl/TRDRNA2_/TRDRNA2_93700_c0_seq2:130-1365(+)
MRSGIMSLLLAFTVQMGKQPAAFQDIVSSSRHADRVDLDSTLVAKHRHLIHSHHRSRVLAPSSSRHRGPKSRLVASASISRHSLVRSWVATPSSSLQIAETTPTRPPLFEVPIAEPPPDESDWPGAVATKPVVGIYATYRTYLLWYRQWVEQFGAATVILPNSGNVEDYFPKLNALLIPGGSGPNTSMDVEPFARALINRAIRANKEGDYFPVWGTCLGFEWILQVVSGDNCVVQEDDRYDSIDDPENLVFNQDTFPGRVFQSANESLRDWFASGKVAYNSHVLGIEPHHFAKSAALARTFDILASSSDRKGSQYVSVIQGKKLPIYGVQFHPEMVRFAPTVSCIGNLPKTPEAVAASDYLANFFMSEAAKNNHLSPYTKQTNIMTLSRRRTASLRRELLTSFIPGPELFD